MAGRIQGITVEIGGDTTKLQTALKSVNTEIKNTQSQLKDVEKLLKLDPGNTELLTQKQKALSAEIGATKEKLTTLKTAAEQANDALARGDITQEQFDGLQREIADTEEKLKSLENEYRNFGSVAAQQVAAVGEKMKSVGQDIADEGGKLTKTVTLPIVAAGTAAASKFAEVDKTMQLTNATMGNTAEEAKLLNDAMSEAAANSTFGMDDAATATLNFARAGLDAQQASAALAPAMNLAAGEGGNLDTVSAGLVATINGFQGSFDDAGHYADVFAAACNNSALDVDSLSGAMSVAAPIFSAAGYSVNDAALYMGVMANNGIDANKAANSLKTGLARLVSPAKEGAEMMDQLGISVTNADGTMKDSITIQSELHDTFAQLSESEQIAAASAISGLNTKKRDGFNEMIRDALAGRIDLIVTKSVSRFARNTVDSLTTIRKLKDVGCECYFEKEAIWTFDSKGELLITIMSSLAQEESRSISENVTWGQRKRFADGKVSMPYKRFLGYEQGPDGQPRIVPEQAEIVRRIYDLFMSGMTTFAVAKKLTEDGIPTPGGKQKWQASTVESILTNEKYKGDALLQKRFTVDFLQKKLKPNEGEVPQYYVENSHPAIITAELFEQVQEEMDRRKKLGRRYRTGSLFSCRLVCADCGEFFGPKVWNSTDKYRRTVWQCNAKFKGEHKCTTPHLTEDAIKEKFILAYNQLLPDRERLIEDCGIMRDALFDCSEIDAAMETVLQETEVVAELIRRTVDENGSIAQDQAAYCKRYDGLVQRYEDTKNKLADLQKKRTARQKKAEALTRFMTQVSERNEPLTAFTDGLWLDAIDQVTVQPDGVLLFRFQGGREVTV